MATYNAKRALEILREEGPIELSKRSTRFVFTRVLSTILKPLDPQYHRRFKFHTWRNDLQNCIKYDAPAEPYKIININTDLIQIRNKTTSISNGLGQIKNGNWDVVADPRYIEQEWYIIGLRQRFQQGKKWEDTIYYKKAKERLESDGHVPGADDIEQLEDRFGYMDILFDRIKSNGYKRANRTSKDYKGNFKDDLEVLVNITRDGEIQHYDGIHRFGIAQILDLEIPVQVIRRHKQWQELRDEIHKNGLPEGREDLRDHPDLQDVLD